MPLWGYETRFQDADVTLVRGGSTFTGDGYRCSCLCWAGDDLWRRVCHASCKRSGSLPHSIPESRKVMDVANKDLQIVAHLQYMYTLALIMPLIFANRIGQCHKWSLELWKLWCLDWNEVYKDLSSHQLLFRDTVIDRVCALESEDVLNKDLMYAPFYMYIRDLSIYCLDMHLGFFLCPW